MHKRFIWLEETGERINESEIGCMINPSLHVNKSFKEQVEKTRILHLVKSHNPLLKPH